MLLLLTGYLQNIVKVLPFFKKVAINA